MNKRLFILLIFAVAAGARAADSVGFTASPLRIHLPREIEITNDVPTLSSVAILLGNENTLKQIEPITLGKIAAPGQTIVVDRSVILSRLASAGIDTENILFSGSDQVSVSRRHSIIRAERFVELAKATVMKNTDPNSVYTAEPIRIPEELVLAGKEVDVNLIPYIQKSTSPNLSVVNIIASNEGREIAKRQVSFRLKFYKRSVVAAVDILPGQVITEKNTNLHRTISTNPEAADWTPPYGMVASRMIPADTVVKKSMVIPDTPQTLVKRNQNVIIKIDTLGLLITAIGRTLQDGKAGDYIRVQNVDSQRIIIVKVNEDGTVSPIF